MPDPAAHLEARRRRLPFALLMFQPLALQGGVLRSRALQRAGVGACLFAALHWLGGWPTSRCSSGCKKLAHLQRLQHLPVSRLCSQERLLPLPHVAIILA